jgi:hypothetical protein
MPGSPNGLFKFTRYGGVDPDWEPDHAIISRLRGKERRDTARIAELDAENKSLVEFWWEMVRQGAIRIAELESENAVLKQALDYVRLSLPPSSSFVATAQDIPEPPRRPDGTLRPEPKPWTAPKDAEPSKRVGG